MKSLVVVVLIFFVKLGSCLQTTEATTTEKINDIVDNETTTEFITTTSTDDITPPSTTPENNPADEVSSENSTIMLDNFEDFVVVGIEEGEGGSGAIGIMSEGSGLMEEGSGSLLEGEGIAEELCEDIEDSLDLPQESASYTMTTSDELGMEIEIELQKMPDNTVKLKCKIQENIVDADLEVNNNVETTTATTESAEGRLKSLP